MLKQIKNFLIMTLSITIMAIGVYYFKFPNNFTFGGVTGAAVVFAKITPLSASMFSTIVNMLLLVVGFFFLGKGFAIKTTYATVLLSVELLVLEKLDPLTSRFLQSHLHCFSMWGLQAAEPMSSP